MKKFIIISVSLFLFFEKTFSNTKNFSIYAYVNGLVCEFCARALEKTIGNQDEVENIIVDLRKKVVIVELFDGKNLKEEKLISLINDAGYDVTEIKYGKK
tara:strand:- start:301 stop:600 length:300 start_codon:yes stop_codon:yes gene_type:complete